MAAELWHDLAVCLVYICLLSLLVRSCGDSNLPGSDSFPLERPCASPSVLTLQGLVVRSRGDSDTLADHKLAYCHSEPTCPDLLSAVKTIKPSVLIGMASMPPTVTFTQEVRSRLQEPQVWHACMIRTQTGRSSSGRCRHTARGRRRGRRAGVLPVRRSDAGLQTMVLLLGACRNTSGLACMPGFTNQLQDELCIPLPPYNSRWLHLLSCLEHCAQFQWCKGAASEADIESVVRVLKLTAAVLISKAGWCDSTSQRKVCDASAQRAQHMVMCTCLRA